MKKITFVLISLFIALALSAQSPEAIKYQAVVRNNSGDLVKNTNVSFRISILKGSETGTSVYTETHNVQTNTYGLATFNIGKGTSGGSLASVNWGTDSYFVKVEVDLAGGSSYQLMGTSQLLSVPYALHAATVEDGAGSGLDADMLDGQQGSFYRDADNINSGVLNTARFSAYSDLSSEGRLDNNSSFDLLTQGQADERYIKRIAFNAYNSANDPVAAAGYRKIEFNGQRFDDGLGFNSTSDRFIAPINGVYNFSASVSLDELAGGTRIYVGFYVNGVIYTWLCSEVVDNQTYYYTTGGTTTMKLNATDYVEVWIYCNDASYTIVGTTSDHKYTTFSGHLVYPF